MSKSFLKFKKKQARIRLIRSIMVGMSAAAVGGGLTLLLVKLALIGLELMSAVYIAVGLLLAVGGLTFILGRKSDAKLAAELDEKFSLKARVQTMVEYSGEDGEMFEMQRRDADRALGEVSLKNYKFKGLAIYIVALVLSLAVLAVGFVAEDTRFVVKPEPVEPFELSDLQANGVDELIRYVEKSGLEEEFKTPMLAELRSLLNDLRGIKTKPEMHSRMAEAMAEIAGITYASSTATEMLNALWDTGDLYLKHLARVLDSSSQNTPDWGDFAEKMAEYMLILMGQGEEDGGAEKLSWTLESMSLKMNMVYESCGLAEDDEMYVAVKNLFDNPLVGFNVLMKKVGTMTDESALEQLKQSLDIMSEDTFAAVALNKTNANVGEFAMTRLGSLFSVPIPEFERPEFVKNGESPDGSISGEGDDDDENGVHSGGLGEGAVFGTDDYVLDPKTGKYKKLGDVIAEYNAVMAERLQGDYYTEEQKQAILKYFSLLHSGNVKEEGK